jgi:hypothetical protein
MKQRGIRRAFAAYRTDWPTVNDFFKNQGFVHARDMVNFTMGFENMPTPSARILSTVTTVEADDIPKIYELAPSVFRVASGEALRKYLWYNPHFDARDSMFAIRSRDGAPIAAGIFITNPTFADPRSVDAFMPCFRLGAFGTEDMSTKRIKGVFSFVARLDKTLLSLGMDLLGYAACRLGLEDSIECYATQVASDVPLLAFYQRHFERQGSFPIFERDLTN